MDSIYTVKPSKLPSNFLAAKQNMYRTTTQNYWKTPNHIGSRISHQSIQKWSANRITLAALEMLRTCRYHHEPITWPREERNCSHAIGVLYTMHHNSHFTEDHEFLLLRNTNTKFNLYCVLASSHLRKQLLGKPSLFHIWNPLANCALKW